MSCDLRRTLCSLGLTIFFLISPSGCIAQTNKLPRQREVENKRQEQSPLANEIIIQNLIYDAHVAPPEFAADLLIRIVESALVADQGKKVELLEEAFRRAADTQQKFRREYIGGNVDTQPGYLSYAFDLRMDSLSLRSRAVKAMLPLDAKKARDLFSEISPKLELETLNCSDRLVYNVSEFYETLEKIIQSSFTTKEKRQNLHIYFVTPYLESMISPVQVEPLLKLILDMKASDSQLAALAFSYAKALKTVSGDDRSYSFSISRGDLIKSIGKLLEVSEGSGLKQQLLESLRTYLVRHLTSDRCANSTRRAQPASLPSYVLYANDKFLINNPISENDIKPTSIKEISPVRAYWQSPEAKQLLKKIRRLRYGSGDNPLTNSEKDSSEWQLELSTFLNELSIWSGDKEESQANYFHQKSVLYGTLLELVPKGLAYNLVLQDYIRFLRENSARLNSRIEWFWHVNSLLKKVQSADRNRRTKQLEFLTDSGDAILRLYASFELLKPQNKQVTS